MLDALVVTILLDVKSNSSQADGLTRDPPDSLEREHLVGVVGECFVLATSASLAGGWGRVG